MVPASQADQALNDAQQRGLAAAALADQRDDLALVDVECETTQHIEEIILLVLAAAHAKRFRDAVDRELHLARFHPVSLCARPLSGRLAQPF